MKMLKWFELSRWFFLKLIQINTYLVSGGLLLTSEEKFSEVLEIQFTSVNSANGEDLSLARTVQTDVFWCAPRAGDRCARTEGNISTIFYHFLDFLGCGAIFSRSNFEFCLRTIKGGGQHGCVDAYRVVSCQRGRIYWLWCWSAARLGWYYTATWCPC